MPEALAEGYEVLYVLDLPLNANYRDGNLPAYTTDNRQTAQPFDRVAYYLELMKPDGASQWVYVSMDPFTDDATQLGVPHHLANPVNFQRTVENMNVYSNHPGLVTGHSLDGGVIELWPSDYNVNRGGPFYAGEAGSFDWDDDGNTAGDAGYGSFQIHNPLSRQVLFAWSHWGAADGGNDDIGIGNAPGTSNVDHTGAANTSQYIGRRLVVLTRPGTHVVLDEMPKNNALHPRDLATNKAVVAVAGTEAEGGWDSAVLKVFREGVLESERVAPLDYSAGGAPFSFDVDVPAELAGRNFELFLARGVERRLIRRAVDVVAGDAYLFYGQSNAEAGIFFGAVTTSSKGYARRWTRTFGQNADSADATRNNLSWVPVNGDGMGSIFVAPGAVGQWPLVIGSKIVDQHRVPVALINGARGGHNMVNMQKDDAQPDTLEDGQVAARSYNRLRFRALQAGIASKARAMFFYQGESDQGSPELHSIGWASLVEDWAVDYPALEHIYVTQVRPGCGVTRELVGLREAQRGFADKYPNTSVMTSNGLTAHDGCHFSFINGYERLGLNYFAMVSRDLYDGPDGPNVGALNPARVEFADASRQRIRLVMRNRGATVNLPVGALADFVLTGTAATITGAKVEGPDIVFDLSERLAGGASLEYLSHIGGGDFVTNGAGVGLLSFSLPVASPGPEVRLLSPASSRSATVGETIPIQAAATAGNQGPAVRIEFLVNGVLQSAVDGIALSTLWEVPAAGAHVLEVLAYDAAGNTGRAAVTVYTENQATPGGVTGGLRVWLKAEAGALKDADGFVASWQDQSGNLNHVSQSSRPQQPRYTEASLGNGPALEFDGNDFLQSQSGMPTGSYTKVVRFALDTHNANNNLISSAALGGSAARNHALWFAGTRKVQMHHFGSFVTSTFETPVSTPTVVVASYDAGSNQGSLFVDNRFAGSGTAEGDNAFANFQIGAYAGANNLRGDVSEVIIYDRVLTEAERQAVFDYLDDKYRTPFGRWLKDHLGPMATIADDPRGDGVPAGIEYVLGLDPNDSNAGSSRLPRVHLVGNDIEVRYQLATSRPDVSAELEATGDLAQWEVVPTTSTGIEGGLENRKHVISRDGAPPHREFRLRVRSDGRE